jgi:S-formylglutathione hydrolase FrmB
MKFAAYLPTNQSNEKLPVLIWLSGNFSILRVHFCMSYNFFKVSNFCLFAGLTCNEQNFITKSGFQRYASKHRIIVVCPDTSPSKNNKSLTKLFAKKFHFVFCHYKGGCNIEGEAERWDFGVGAGFYVDATEPKWQNNFRMYSYVNSEVN